MQPSWQILTSNPGASAPTAATPWGASFNPPRKSTSSSPPSEILMPTKILDIKLDGPRPPIPRDIPKFHAFPDSHGSAEETLAPPSSGSDGVFISGHGILCRFSQRPPRRPHEGTKKTPVQLAGALLILFVVMFVVVVVVAVVVVLVVVDVVVVVIVVVCAAGWRRKLHMFTTAHYEFCSPENNVHRTLRRESVQTPVVRLPNPGPIWFQMPPLPDTGIFSWNIAPKNLSTYVNES